MNPFRSFQQSIAPACFAALTILGCAASQAATVRFTPAGSQQDADTILDIITGPNKQITFSNYFDNSGDNLLGIPLSTRQIDYVITYDPTELTYTSSNLDVPNVISNFCIIGAPCGSTISATAPNQLTVRHRTALTNLLTPRPEFLLDTITFTTTPTLNPFPGDGIEDYSFAGSNRATLLEVTTISNFTSNTVEVQTPGPLPILGAGVAFGSVRRLRRFSSQLKQPSVG